MKNYSYEFYSMYETMKLRKLSKLYYVMNIIEL